MMQEPRWIAVPEGVQTFEHPKVRPMEVVEEATLVPVVAAVLNCVTLLTGRWPRLAGRLCNCGAYRLVVTKGAST